MAILIYEPFQNTNNWVAGNGQNPTITVVQDPKGQYQKVVNFASVTDLPDSFSSVISNNFKSFTVSFDYLGLPKNQQIAVNLGCVISIADGAGLTGLSMALGGAIKNAYPPVGSGHLCTTYGSQYCTYKYYTKQSSFTFLTDDSQWHHYSISFSTTNNNIRVALADFVYSNYPEGNNAGDCYFANLLVTDSYGPSPFIATSNPENFRSISVDVLNQVADTVSYVNSNAAVTINLGGNYTSGGFAAGDVLNDIKNIIGSGFNDVLAGSSANNQLEGGSGNDMLTAGLGNDILIGGSGADTFVIANEISSAKINDLEIGVDKIDLRLFNGFYSLSIIKANSTYTNGNTVINLGSGKLLTLQNTNPADLTEETFLLPDGPTAQPTLHPTTSSPSYSMAPSPIPTITPTDAPTIKPSSKPSASPTTSHPTFSPSTSSPSYSPSATPTAGPSVAPSPAPSAMPTIAPTDAPTTKPSSKPSPAPSTNKYVLTGSDVEFVGGTFYEDITVNSVSNLKLTLNGGGDRITFFSNPFSEKTITDFTPEDGSIIDISSFEDVSSFSDLRKLMTFTGGTVITFDNKQKIILQNIPLSRLKPESFVYNEHVEDDGNTGSEGFSLEIFGGIIAASVVGTGLVGYSGYMCYNHFSRSSNKNTNTNSQKLEVNNFYSDSAKDHGSKFSGSNPNSPRTPSAVVLKESEYRVLGRDEEALAVHGIKYDNPVLNMPGALDAAAKLKGAEGVGALINIGLDKESFVHLKEQISAHGLERGVADSIARNELKSIDLNTAKTFGELNQISEYLPSTVYVLKEMLYPKIQGFAPTQLKDIFNVLDNYVIPGSIAMHFISGNLASFYTGSSALKSNINSLYYASKYYIPSFLGSYMPDWAGGKCAFSIAYNSAIIAGKSYLTASIPDYSEVMSGFVSVIPQCLTHNSGAKLSQEEQNLVDVIDMTTLITLLSLANFNDKSVLGKLGEALSMAPALMLVDISTKTILSTLENKDNTDLSLVGQCEGGEAIQEL